jgi:hypothetical protein
MKRIVLIAIALPLSIVISYCSSFITVWIDYSTTETVGVTRLKGLPIWFYEQAPGIGIISGWHLQRLLWNTGFWIVLLFCVMLFLTRQTKSRTMPSSESSETLDH